jgi:hypothetical protein
LRRVVSALRLAENPIEIMHIKQLSSEPYFPFPDWFSGLKSAKIEASLIDDAINHVQRGFQGKTVINVNNGSMMSEPEKKELKEESMLLGTNLSKMLSQEEYYIVDIDYVNDLIQISATLSGNAIQLTNVPVTEGITMTMAYPRYSSYITAPTANMVPNIDIQFTGSSLGGVILGTNYYINDIIDGTNFTISTNKVTLTTASTVGGSTNTVVATTTSLVPLNPIVFSGTIFDSATQPGTTYYISKIVDATSFNITETIIRTEAFSTTFGTNVVTMDEVAGFVVGQPIIFSCIRLGTSFGNIVPETVYYILTINAVSKQITISADKTNTFGLTDATGLIQART